MGQNSLKKMFNLETLLVSHTWFVLFPGVILYSHKRKFTEYDKMICLFIFHTYQVGGQTKYKTPGLNNNGFFYSSKITLNYNIQVQLLHPANKCKHKLFSIVGTIKQKPFFMPGSCRKHKPLFMLDSSKHEPLSMLGSSKNEPLSMLGSNLWKALTTKETLSIMMTNSPTNNVCYAGWLVDL